MLARALRLWLAITLIGGVVFYQRAHIDRAEAPAPDAQHWAWSALEAARNRTPLPEATVSAARYRPTGPMIISTFHRGRLLSQSVHRGSLVEAIRARAQQPIGNGHELVISVSLGEGPLVTSVPFLSALSVVPLREGVLARWRDREAFLPPCEMRALDLYDGAVPTPLPDLTFGTRIDVAFDVLARQLGTDRETLLREGAVARFASTTLTRAGEPDATASAANLRRAATEGAEFLLRHQKRSGKYTYIYDARTGRERPSPYNMPRHAGTTYFLAQMAHMANMPEARAGAIAALQWTQRTSLRQCGGPEALCVESDGRVDVGSAALTAVAATELLKSGELPWVRAMLTGLTAFLRSMQRDDGELMHVYDLRAQKPVDVQLLYYSGEAAFALLNAHRVTHDERDLQAAKRLMAHLTGAGWNFFGSRYYYGEEHWTCLAVGAAADRIPVDAGADFCARWTEFNRAVQYQPGQTPWPIAGTYGVGPLLLPRLTPVASRTEAAISVYELLNARGEDTDALRVQIERGLGALLRYRWAPGPSYLFFRPESALGGMTGSPSDTTARNDFVQHAGSAMIRWAHVIEAARDGHGQSPSR